MHTQNKSNWNFFYEGIIMQVSKQWICATLLVTSDHSQFKLKQITLPATTNPN